MKKKIYLDRIPFLSWIILPLFGVLLATNYIFGLTRKPTWAVINDINPQVAGINSDSFADYGKTIYEWDGQALLTLWFDDQWITQYSVAFPELKKEGFPGALAVQTDAVGWDGFMSWAQIKRVAANGWEITSHSRSHQCDLSKLDPKTFEEELLGSYTDLNNRGYKVNFFVTPCGVSNLDLINISKNYYSALRTSEEGLNKLPLENHYDLKLFEPNQTTKPAQVEEWILDAKNQKSWIILMFHKIDDTGGEFTISNQLFSEIIEIIKKSQITVVTPSQVLSATRK